MGKRSPALAAKDMTVVQSAFLAAVTPEVEMLRAALANSGSATISGSLGSIGLLRGKRRRGSHMPGSLSGASGDGTDSNTSGLQSPPYGLHLVCRACPDGLCHCRLIALQWITHAILQDFTNVCWKFLSLLEV
jgi:hypothetical protein